MSLHPPPQRQRTPHHRSPLYPARGPRAGTALGRTTSGRHGRGRLVPMRDARPRRVLSGRTAQRPGLLSTGTHGWASPGQRRPGAEAPGLPLVRPSRALAGAAVKKSVLWLMSTLTVVVLLFGSHPPPSGRAAATAESSAVAPVDSSTDPTSTGSGGTSGTGGPATTAPADGSTSAG